MGKLLLAVVEGYLFGSISSSVILSNWLFHTDVRRHGSGNAGATNAAPTEQTETVLLQTNSRKNRAAIVRKTRQSSSSASTAPTVTPLPPRK